jgi:hypothetical protein
MGDGRGPKRSLARAIEYLAARLGLNLVDAADITTQWAEDDKIRIWIKVWDNKTRSWKYLKIKACEWSHQYISVKLSLNSPAKCEVIETVKGVERLANPDSVGFIVNWRQFERLVDEIAPVPVPAAGLPDADESMTTEESIANGEAAPAPAPAENAPVTAESVKAPAPAANTALPVASEGGETTHKDATEKTSALAPGAKVPAPMASPAVSPEVNRGGGTAVDALVSAQSPPSDQPAVAHSAPRTSKRRGPKPGTIDRYGKADRALFPRVTKLMKSEQLTRLGAANRLAEAGKVAGTGTIESRARRLANRHRNEVGN